MENEEIEEDSEIEETENNEESEDSEEKEEKGFFGKLKEKFIGEPKKEIEETENNEELEEKEEDNKEPDDSEEDESEIEKANEEAEEEPAEKAKEEEPAEEESDDGEEDEEEKEEVEETEEKEKEELNEEKDLIEHAAEAVEHITSETAKELDESKEVENIKKVEAALFIAGRFLTLQELVMLTDINPLMLKEILEKLIEKYNDNSGIEIIEKGGGWKMDVCKEHVHMINKLATGNSEFTKAEQETLAVIAYKQPVKQSVIINIRGNKAYEHIKKFIENELVVGKRVGHTKELRLSDDFYEYFHIRNKNVENLENISNEGINNEDTEEKSIISKEQDDEDSSSDKQKDIDKDKNVEEDDNAEEDEEDSGEEVRDKKNEEEKQENE